MTAQHQRIVDCLGREALDSTVYVTRQPDPRWNDPGGDVPVASLHDFHTRTVSGGWGEETPFPHLYARGCCVDLPVGHSGSHGRCPHEIVVCVHSAKRKDVWSLVCDLAGYRPPSEEEVRTTSRKAKAEAVATVTGGRVPPDGLPRCDGELFCEALGTDVSRLACALACESDPWLGPALFNLETGEVEWLEDGPEEPDRFEKIIPLDPTAVKLLSVDDVEEIAAAFWWSRGFS